MVSPQCLLLFGLTGCNRKFTEEEEKQSTAVLTSPSVLRLPPPTRLSPLLLNATISSRHILEFIFIIPNGLTYITRFTVDL